MKPLVFLVDDDDSLRRVLARELADAGFEVRPFATGEGLVEAVVQDGPQAVLLDLRLSGMDGLELLRRIRASDPASQVIVFTGHGGVPDAVQAMRLGAHDFLTKPVQLDVLEQVLRQAIETRALMEANARLQRAIEPSKDSWALIGSSPAMLRLEQEVRRVAAAGTNVLVQGENGTGKELVARRIHALGPRASKPFVVVNCGAIASSLIESELFGHEKGAFTGADKRRMGLFEAAHEGTLFLDEIGELPKAVQPVLLRALQFQELRAVGSERTRKVDVRVVSATNRDLLAASAESTFREDLYYRVATIVIDVPPLRERREDIRELAMRFVARAAARLGRKIALDESALRRLDAHDWPGNVRELENAAERLCVLGEGETIDAELVERYVLRRPKSGGALPTLQVEELERLAIEAAMAKHSGDKPAAAAELGIALKTLYNKLDRFGLRGGREPGGAAESKAP